MAGDRLRDGRDHGAMTMMVRVAIRESPHRVEYDEALAALDAVYTDVRELADGLTPSALLEFSRCRGWVVADVLLHLLTDAQRALIALASPTSEPADQDFVTYWRAFAEDHAADPDEWVPGALWVRRSASAFRDGSGLTAIWRETAPAAVRAAGRADPGGRITTQGYVLPVADLLATLAVEAVVHYLDMTVHLEAPEPAPIAVALATRTLDGLWSEHGSTSGHRAQPAAKGEGPYPAGWSAHDYLLKGTGRIALTPADRAALGAAADALPLLS